MEPAKFDPAGRFDDRVKEIIAAAFDSLSDEDNAEVLHGYYPLEAFNIGVLAGFEIARKAAEYGGLDDYQDDDFYDLAVESLKPIPAPEEGRQYQFTDIERIDNGWGKTASGTRFAVVEMKDGCEFCSRDECSRQECIEARNGN